MWAAAWGSLSQSCIASTATEGPALMPLSQGQAVTITDGRVPGVKPRKSLACRDQAPSVR